MIVFFWTILLLIFLAGFLGLQFFDISIFGIPVASSLNQVGIDPAILRAFLGLGVVFCQFVIILVSMLPRIGSTIIDIIRLVLRFVPLGIFLTAAWQTFSPVVFSLLPPSFANAFGVTNTGNITQVVNTTAFTQGVLITVVAMLLFVIANNILGLPKESPEVKSLKAENAKLRKEIRRGL